MPQGRESFGMVAVDNKSFIFGGLGLGAFNDTVQIAQNEQQFQCEKMQMNGDIPIARYGHTWDLYAGQIGVLYGGEKYHDLTENFKFRECFNDVHLYMIKTNQWKYLQCFGEYIDGRRNHSATIVGKLFIVYGGINSKGNFLNDLWALDLKLTVKDHYNPPIAFHKCCSIFHPDRSRIIVGKEFDQALNSTQKNLIKIEGIYFFGGKHSNSEFVNNNIKILKIDQKEIEWINVEISGVPPSQRYRHTMTPLIQLGIVVVIGGLNEQSQNVHLNDLFVLQLNTMEWIEVKKFGIEMIPRSSHCAVATGSQMIVFGGMNLNGLVKTDLLIIEFNQNKASTLIYANKQSIMNIQLPNQEIQKSFRIMKNQIGEGKSRDLVRQFSVIPKM